MRLIFEHAQGQVALRGVPESDARAALGRRWSWLRAARRCAYRDARRRACEASRDQVRQTLVEVFGIPASKGSVDSAIMRMSAVLADPWTELREAIRKAQVVHADETTWRLRGATQWLWVAASALVACFRIDPTRTQRAAKELLGEEFGGFVVSDRYAGYHFLDVLQQQLCWCHCIRQLIVPALGRRGPPRHPAGQARQGGDRRSPRVPRRRPRPRLADRRAHAAARADPRTAERAVRRPARPPHGELRRRAAEEIRGAVDVLRRPRPAHKPNGATPPSARCSARRSDASLAGRYSPITAAAGPNGSNRSAKPPASRPDPS